MPRRERAQSNRTGSSGSIRASQPVASREAREVGRGAGRQAEVAGDPVDVGVHREEEAGRREAASRPEAEVDVAASAPSSGGRGGPSCTRSRRRGRGGGSGAPAAAVRAGDVRSFPEHRKEAVEGRDVVGAPVVPGGEEGAEGALASGASRRRRGGTAGGIRRRPTCGRRPSRPGTSPSVPRVRNAAGCGPRAAKSRSSEALIDATRPKARDEARKAADLPVVGARVAVRKEERVRVEAPPAPGLLEVVEPRRERRNVRGTEPSSHRTGSIPGARVSFGPARPLCW